MTQLSKVLGLLAIGVAGSVLQVAAPAAEHEPQAMLRWQYKVLTKEQLLELGNKDLAAGLNKLGDQGWELVGFKDGYIFKRSKGGFISPPAKEQVARQRDEIKSYMALRQSEVDLWKDRVAWAKRMVKKGFLAPSSIQAEELWLKRAELALDQVRRDLQALPPDPKESTDKERKPEK
jgi:hypothetical protein